MKKFPGNSAATVLGTALLGVALGAGLVAVQSALPRFALAQDHGSGGGHEGGKGGKGGHDSGGHDSGGHESGGHESGGKGGAEKGRHGTRGSHQGHASGQHDAGGHGGEGGRASNPHGGPGRFGGGSGLATLDAVPEGPGQHGASYGPGPRNQFRYWGGWSIPGEEPTAVVTIETVPLSSGGGGGSGLGLNLSAAERCEGIGGKITPAERIAGRNLARINAVHGLVLGEGAQPEKVAPFLLANLQEELEKATPDFQLAGVYLGTLAEKPVTPQMVAQVAQALCVVLPSGEAELVAQVAEEQRTGRSERRVASRGGQ